MKALPPALDLEFRNPYHGGMLPPNALCGEAENPACGDHLELGIEVAGGVIRSAGFQARGCSAVIACASLTCRTIEQRTVAEIAALDIGRFLSSHGRLSPERRHAVAIVSRALRGALARVPRDCHP